MQLPYSNLQVEHWNPGAEKPLILPIHVICNTDDEQLQKNIRKNSRRPGEWLRVEQEHDGIAVLCGSGPSLADTIEDIRVWRSKGATIFAMNGAAKFLHDQGIIADYQVILDAREETADLVGPAKAHLFASQVHPKCFKRAPDAKLWHLQIHDIESLFPDYPGPYALIGGSASVGNTATCVAYAMGYRNLQLYGYDSSHKDDQSHAFRQPMNDGDPCAFVTFCGKDYKTSLTMKLQAEKFQTTSQALIKAGCHIEVHGYGLLPDMFNAPKTSMSEKEKYERLYSFDEYRAFSPGEQLVDLFMEKVKPSGRVIDFGCGTGRAGLRMKWQGLDPLLIDFVTNSRDLEAHTLPFRQHDLTKPLPEKADYGFCSDVMEHIPTEDVERVITNIMDAAKTVFFQISTVDDVCGALIGQPLHLTVQDHDWWESMFRTLGYSVTWHENKGSESLFVVTQNINHLMELYDACF